MMSGEQIYIGNRPASVACTRFPSQVRGVSRCGGQPKVLQAYVGSPSYRSGGEAIPIAPDGQSFVTGGRTVRLWQTRSASVKACASKVSKKRTVHRCVGIFDFRPEGSRIMNLIAHARLRLCSTFLHFFGVILTFALVFDNAGESCQQCPSALVRRLAVRGRP